MALISQGVYQGFRGDRALVGAMSDSSSRSRGLGAQSFQGVWHAEWGWIGEITRHFVQSEK